MEISQKQFKAIIEYSESKLGCNGRCTNSIGECPLEIRLDNKTLIGCNIIKLFCTQLADLMRLGLSDRNTSRFWNRIIKLIIGGGIE